MELFNKKIFLNKISFNVSEYLKLRRGFIDYFVNVALLDYTAKIAISSAQFGRGNFSNLNWKA